MSKEPWTRQRDEIESYNTFLSAVNSRVSYHGFGEQGYRVTNFFPSIPVREEPNAEPDFVLFDGQTAFLVEVKSGIQFDSKHSKQLERCNRVSINDLEDFFKMSDIETRLGLTPQPNRIETFIVYDGLDENYVDNCLNEWDDCREGLKEIETEAPVFGQEAGGKLQLLYGEFSSPELNTWLEYGISLPQSPRTTIHLTDGLEMESIANAVCSVWGQRAVSGPITVSTNEIRSHFNHRELQPNRVLSAFEFLTRVGACSEVGKRTIRFDPEKMGTILNIGQILDKEFTGPDLEDYEDVSLQDYL